MIPKFASSLPMPKPINATPVPRPAISKPPFTILVLYPGHDYGSSPTSTIGSEKRTNLVMQKVSEAEFVERMGV